VSTPGATSHRVRWAAPLAVFAASLGVLWYHAAPGVTFHDSGEFALAAASAGIPHAPGAPSWMMAASAFYRLILVNDAARATNLFSAFCGAITLALLYALCASTVRRMFPTAFTWCPHAAALCSVLVCLTSSAFVELSLSTEQYTLLTALLLATLLLGDTLLTRAAKDHDSKWRSTALGILWGLALGNHPSQLALLFPLLAFVWFAGSACPYPTRARTLLAACVSAGFVFGLLIFLWVPIRSVTHPLIDHADVESFSGLIQFLSRSEWASRPIAEAPPGFLGEWLATYAPLEQLGWLGALLSILGMTTLLRHGKRWFVILIAVAVPYAGGMLLSHMKQANIDINYIRHYGVMDWHVPLYVLASFAAGIGVARLLSYATTTPIRALESGAAGKLVAAACAGVLAFSAFGTIHKQSLRGYEGARTFIAALLNPLPGNAVVLSQTDNVSYMLGYEILAGSKPQNRWIGQDRTRFNAEIGSAGWSREYLVNAIRNRIAANEVQPFKLAPPNADELMDRPVYVEYDPTFPRSATFLVPAGFLFEVTDEPVSNEDVFRALQRKDGPASTPPKPLPDLHRWEKEAWAMLYQRRAGYFAVRGLWDLAESSYARSLDYQGSNGEIWFCLADAQEKTGKPQKAAESYGKAIKTAPHLEGPRSNLAILFAGAGDLETAETLLVEELKMNPESETARENLSRVRTQRQHGGTE